MNQPTAGAENIRISSDQFLNALVDISTGEPVAILDSCNRTNLGSRLLIAGFDPSHILTLNHTDPDQTLTEFDEAVNSVDSASIFTISYDFGLKLLGIEHTTRSNLEPDIYAAFYKNLVVYDYTSGTFEVLGNRGRKKQIENRILEASATAIQYVSPVSQKPASNFTREEYMSSVRRIKEEIRAGNTYQTNLTQQFSTILDEDFNPLDVFLSLRKSHPAAFAAYIPRQDDFVVSISPERFVRIFKDQNGTGRIESSPIKGTAKRTGVSEIDEQIKAELLRSTKNRAENTMIVDLIRNDLGRVSEYGSVVVDRLCELEEHPTLYHLVSTVSGNLRKDVSLGDVLRTVFPCGSITGCPKISTMSIIEEIETRSRGLSMGAIGYTDFNGNVDMSVAIRTMVIDKSGNAVFNVGGGIVIDSDPNDEFEESMLKAEALFRSLGTRM